MATELDYLIDFDVLIDSADVVAVQPLEDGRTSVTLDRTCFYPRGGGQDWDTGSITANGATFVIEEVRLDAEGVVQHIGAFKSGTFTAGQHVKCLVDEDRRLANTRLHSAGHLIDMAVSRLEIAWVAGKGAHYPHMSFVEYDNGGVPHNESTVQSIRAKLAELLQSSYQNKIMFIPVAEMGHYCRRVPDNLPTNKPSRIVLYADDFGIPCGGTHVRQAGDIGEITITKVKSKGGITKVSYAVTGIN